MSCGLDQVDFEILNRNFFKEIQKLSLVVVFILSNVFLIIE